MAEDGALADEPIVDEETGTDQGQEESQLEMLSRWSDPSQTLNICDDILDREDGDAVLGSAGQLVVRQFDLDEESRRDWLKDSKEAMDLAMQVAKEKTFPWPNASNVIYPVLSTAAIQFAARAYPAIVADANVVKSRVYGRDEGVPQVDPMTGQPVIDPQTQEPVWAVPPGAKRARADRIAEHMSYQLLEEMTEWEEETDKLLHILPIVGCVFRKTYYEPAFGRNMDVMVRAEDLVIDYHAKSMETAPRVSEVIEYYPHEIEEKVRAGIFLRHEYGPTEEGGDDEDAPHEFIEQHRRLDLDDDGYAEPYIVTVHRQTSKVVRIVARYDVDGIRTSRVTGEIIEIKAVDYYTKFDFLPNPEGGIYGVGFGRLMRPINESINTALNQLFDAGTLQNLGGGFIGRGLSMHTGAVKRKLGEWTYVNVPGSKVREAIVPLQHQPPSDTLFRLLGLMIEAAKELSSSSELLSGQQSHANMPATSVLALIEQGMKVFTGVYKRVYRSLTKEYDKLYRLNSIFLEKHVQFLRGDTWMEVTQQDYLDGAAIQPVSDPSMVSDLQELAKAELLKEFANDPLMNGIEVRKRIFRAAKVHDIEQLVVSEPPPNPEILMGAEELRIKEIGARARAMADMSQAARNMAGIDQQKAENWFRWIEIQMDALQGDVENMHRSREMDQRDKEIEVKRNSGNKENA